MRCARKKRATAKPKTEQRNDTVNQRTVFSIAKEVTADLLGHREMHVRRASLPVVVSSRVPVRLDGNLRGIDRESTPPHLFSVKGFLKHGSVGVCRRFAIHPARTLCVAGYFRCIGTGPMHFPATFPVAPVSVVLPLVCSMSSPREVSARRLWWCRFLSSRFFDGVGKPRAMGG